MRRTAPDLSSVIQEIVGLQDWQPGHSLSLIIKNAGSTNVRRVIGFERFSFDPSLSPARLMIAYSTEGLPTPTETPTPAPTNTPIPPSPVPTLVPTIAPTTPPQPTTPPSCGCYLDWFGGICLFSNVQQDFTASLHMLKNSTVDLTLFHRVENEILAKTPEGQRFINLYYMYSPEVIQLAEADPSIKTQTQELIDLWTSNLQALVDGNGDQTVITAEQINAAKDFANHLSANASPELKQAIADTLTRHPLDPLVNKTMNQAWASLNEYQPAWYAIVALDKHAHQAIKSTGNGNISVHHAGIFDNSNANDALADTGNGAITVDPGYSISVVGNYSDNHHLISPTPETGAKQITDPLASLPAPANPGGTCQKINVSGNTTLTLTPGCYNGIQVSGKGNLILNPGLYYLTGDFSATGQGTISGSGVMIYMKSGAVSFTGQGNITISPPASGAYAGMALFVDRSNNKSVSVTGNSGSSITGTIYAPDSQITVTGMATLY